MPAGDKAGGASGQPGLVAGKESFATQVDVPDTGAAPSEQEDPEVAALRQQLRDLQLKNKEMTELNNELQSELNQLRL